MKNKVLVAILLLVVPFGCGSKIINSDYEKSVSFFPNELISHFPKDITGIEYGVSSNVIDEYEGKSYGFGANTLMLYEYFNKDEYISETKKLRDVIIKSYNTLDSTLLLLFPYTIEAEIDGKIYTFEETSEKNNQVKRNIEEAISLPIPVFDFEQFRGTEFCGLNNKFSINVIEAKSGKYIDEKYLSNSKYVLPEKWRHGYTRGVAFNDTDNIIIYWISIW